jgi:hypothetical protein
MLVISIIDFITISLGVLPLGGDNFSPLRPFPHEVEKLIDGECFLTPGLISAATFVVVARRRRLLGFQGLSAIYAG